MPFPEDVAFIAYQRSAHALASAFASAFASGEQTVERCMSRASDVLGAQPLWLPGVVQRYLNAFDGRSRPRRRQVERFMYTELLSVIFPLACEVNEGGGDNESAGDDSRVRRDRLAELEAQFTIRSWLTNGWRMQPVPAAVAWSVPPIESTTALAEWLGVSLDELDWFAALKAHERRNAASKFHHYHYRLTPKQSGGYRLIEAPQRRLKAIQRQLLTEILERVPTRYSAAHGFVKGRSIKTFAEPHVNKRVVLRMDLHDFFPAIGRARVQAVFRTLGYPESVANALGGLCTNIAPRSLFRIAPRTAQDTRVIYETRKLYTRPHLPQGAPTSPALANICAYRMDSRLTGLAEWGGASYTRYADDIAFSGGADFARFAVRYGTEIAAIAAAEGWSVHHRKTRIMRRGVRQQLAGIVVNERMNIRRSDFDTLKAILTNCVRHGAPTQNRGGVLHFREHLAGRVNWVASINAVRGQKLRELFEQIEW